MKKYLSYLGILLVAGAVYVFNNPPVNFEKVNPDGIHFFKGNWEQALAKSKKEQKPIFLDIYATWCGPCKKLAKYTFSDPDVAKYYNEHFINLSLDGEKDLGLILANTYQIKGYPALLFIDENGNIIQQTSGYHNSRQFVKLGGQILNLIKNH